VLKILNIVRFEVLTATNMKKTGLLGCSALMMEVVSSSETGSVSTGLHGAASQRTVIFMLNITVNIYYIKNLH
jgi:hypothetical protein